MLDPATIPETPPSELRFHLPINLRAKLRELWRSRELIATLTERDLRARYKQEILGILWVVITPVIYMLVFSFFFKRVARVDTGDVPYRLFSYVGLLPWTFFSSGLSAGSTVLIAQMALLNKVYCPREVFPIASIGTAAIDNAMQWSVLLVLFGLYTFAPSGTAVYLPVLLVVLLAFTVGLTMMLSALTVYVRDLRRIIPVLLQIGLFATPVGYGIDKYPEWLVRWYALVNPLVGVIDGYRRCVLYDQAPRWDLVGLGAINAFAMLIAGFVVFKKLEPGIADVA